MSATTRSADGITLPPQAVGGRRGRFSAKQMLLAAGVAGLLAGAAYYGDY